MTNDGGNRGKYHGKSKETSPFSHTPLSRTSSERGNVGTVKRRNNEGRMTNDEGRGEYEVVARDVV